MAGFMAGFGSTFANLIEEDRKYYRDAAAKRRDYIQTYGTRAVIEREDKANAALGVANMLMDRGFSKEYVTSIAANNGVRSMVDFADQISKRTDLTEKDIKEIEASAKDFVKDNPDEDLATVVKRAYGLYKSTKDPVARKRNIFGAMLGLDASMMEDDVLNDMYIDGYTGSDIYRIMGSAGPGAGKPMGVKLPPKPFTFKQNNDFINVKMVPSLESSIAQERAYIMQEQGKSPGVEATRTLQTLSNKLDTVDELIKNNKYSEAMQTYLETDNIKYGSSFVASLQQFDEFYPGAVSRNPLLTDSFITTYRTQIGDIEDDAAAAETTETSVTTPKAPEVTTDIKQPPKGDGVKKFDTADEFNKAVEAGEVVNGDRVKVGDGDVSTFDAPETDLGDMTGAPGFREEPAASEEEPVDETIRSSRREKRTASESDVNVLEIISDFFTKSSTGSRGRNVNRGSAVGVSEAPVEVEELKNVLTRAVDTPAYKELQELIAERTGMSFEEAESAIKKVMIDIPKRSSWTYNSQPADENGRLLRTDDILFDTLVYDRQNEPFPDSFYIDEGYTQEQLNRMREEVDQAFKDAEAGTSTKRTEPRFITYEDWEGMSKEKRKMFGLDVSKTKIQNITRGGLVPIPEDVVLDMGAPDVQSIIRSGTLGDTRSDQADMETPRSMVVENFTTRGRNAMPSGLMSPPREFAPKLGQAEFGDLIDRVHGSSKAAEAFNDKVSSGKVTAADVTRLIKATRKLPNTKSKDNLLQSLFDLRDALNNR